MKNINNKDNCSRQAYVPASVRVIELTSRRGICVLQTSTINNPFGGDEEEW